LFGKEYNIEANVYDASEFGIAQRRTRAIIKLYRKGKKWSQPIKAEKNLNSRRKNWFFTKH
jgi:DNA (cytosine-5)-methyltransferase 1